MACVIIIGFLIYGAVMLIGLHSLELTPKKAVDFTGLSLNSYLAKRGSNCPVTRFYSVVAY